MTTSQQIQEGVLQATPSPVNAHEAAAQNYAATHGGARGPTPTTLRDSLAPISGSFEGGFTLTPAGYIYAAVIVWFLFFRKK